MSKGTLDNLFEAGWVGPKGRRQTPGRPVTWATTDGFLDHFGLEAISDLPGMDDLKTAGLLDPRPAIEAYSNHGEMKGPSADAGREPEFPRQTDEGAPAPDEKAEEEEEEKEMAPPDAGGGKPEKDSPASGDGTGRGLAAAGPRMEF